MLTCEKCGAVYEDNWQNGRCAVSTDGGGICRGALREAAVSAGRVVPAPGGLQTHETLSRVLTEALAGPDPLTGILSGVQMRRSGPPMTDGRTVAIVVFANSNDRAEFANYVVRAGGKVFPA